MFNKTKAAAALTLAATAALAFTGVANAGAPKPNAINLGDVQMIAVDGSSGLVHTIRHLDGSWQKFGRLPDHNGVTALTSTLLNGEENAFFQFATPNGPQLAHLVRHADGTWDLNASTPAEPAGGTVDDLAATTVNGQIDMIGRVGGAVQLTTLKSDGTWTPWAAVPMGGKSVRSVAAAPDNGTLRVVELSADGKSVGDFDLYPNGNWSLGTWTDANPDPNYTALSVAAAYTYGQLQVGTVQTYRDYYRAVFHTVLSDGGTWDPFRDVEGPAGYLNSNAEHIAMTYSEGDMQLAVATEGGGLFHTVRYSDGRWQTFGNVEGVAGNLIAGQVTLAGATF